MTSKKCEIGGNKGEEIQGRSINEPGYRSIGGGRVEG